MSYNWYILQVKPGSENAVLSNIEVMQQDFGEGKFIEEVFCPSRDGAKDESSGRKKKTRHLMPGYIFIKMDMKKGSLNKVLVLPGVSRCLGDGKEPKIICQEELDRLKESVDGIKSDESISVSLEKADKVEVMDGIMKGFAGEVISVDHKKQMAKVMVVILGRALPVELELQKIKKVD